MNPQNQQSVSSQALPVSHSMEMLQVVFRSVDSLSEQAKNMLSSYMTERMTAAGGFKNRADRADLYYSLFGLSCCHVLGIRPDIAATSAWLAAQKSDSMSLINLSSLAKCLSVMPLLGGEWLQRADADWIVSELQKFRTSDGGFSYDGEGRGFPYAAFLAMNILQDTGNSFDNPDQLIASLKKCQKADGRFFNPESSSTGLLLSTVAGLLTLRQLTGDVCPKGISWIISQFDQHGGFKADPAAELPDMLSTAVALFALRVCGIDMAPFRQPARDFVELHWLDSGTFCATLLDEKGDCEYAYYGLLALGALNDR